MNLFLRVSIVLTILVVFGASLLSVHTAVQNNHINQLITQTENYRPHHCEGLENNSDLPKYIKRFVNIGNPAIPALIKLINHEWPHVRYVAVVSLGELNAKEATPYLIESLSAHSDLDVDLATTEVLIKFNARESILKFISIIDIKYSDKKACSALALGKFKAKEAIPALVKLLDDEHFYIRSFAAISLVEIGAKDKIRKESIKDIQDILNWPGDYGVRARRALKALGAEVPEEK